MMEDCFDDAFELMSNPHQLARVIKALVAYMYDSSMVGDVEALQALEKIDSGQQPISILKEVMGYAEVE